jgi:hypothetical protein
MRYKVNVSIPVPDPYPCTTIAPISDSFSPICAHACFYSQGCNQCKCMTWLNVTGYYSLHGNGCNLHMQIAIYNDLLWKFISNSYYFRKIYFLRITSLHPKFYMPIFLWDVESSPNYTEKLIFAGIGTITLQVHPSSQICLLGAYQLREPSIHLPISQSLDLDLQQCKA